MRVPRQVYIVVTIYLFIKLFFCHNPNQSSLGIQHQLYHTTEFQNRREVIEHRKSKENVKISFNRLTVILIFIGKSGILNPFFSQHFNSSSLNSVTFLTFLVITIFHSRCRLIVLMSYFDEDVNTNISLFSDTI